MSIYTAKTILPSGGGTSVPGFTAPVKYAGRWYFNTTLNRTTAGDVNITPSQMTLDPTFMNVSPSSLLSSSSTSFAIQCPVQGVYTFTWLAYGTMTVANGAVNNGCIYLAAHTYNGVQNLALGSSPPISYRLANNYINLSNPTGSSDTYAYASTATATREFKAGDLIQPWMWCNSNTNSVQGGNSASTISTALTVVLNYQTA